MENNGKILEMIDTIQNPELGYYQVGEVKHLGKISAMIDGTIRNIHPEWKFNDDVFDSYDWSVEPTESLQELYTQRAKDIRERYDYVILMYSGGSDSQAILDAYLKSNLQIDEIIVMHPKMLENTYTPNNTNHSPLNVLSEWDYTMKPKLHWLAQHYPKIKITTFDWSEGIMDYKIEDGFILERSCNFTPYCPLRNNIYKIDSVNIALEKYKNVGIILGVDKPRVCFHDNAYKLYFLDIVTNGVMTMHSESLRKNKVEIEFFYWHPASCKLLAKQAHQLVKFFELYPGFRTFVTWPINNPYRRTWYETSVRPIIYPDMDLSFFQANKFSEMTVSWDEILFQIGKRDEILGITKENFTFLKSVIDSKYFHDVDGIPALVGFVSKMRPIKFV